MATKKQLLENLREFSASEVAEAIRAGEVTMYELSKSGRLTPLMRRRIEAQLSGPSGEVAPAQPPQPAPAPTPQPAPQPVFFSDPMPQQQYGTAPIAMTPVMDNRGMFKRIFSFKGRIRRLEYDLSYIFFLLWIFLIVILAYLPDVSPDLAVIIYAVMMIPGLWFMYAQGAKRCHDRGNSGWFQLIPFYIFVMMFGDSDCGDNEYGNNPKS